MDIVEAARLLGYEPLVIDRVVARIPCPWCGSKCWLSLLFNRFVCNRCGESGNAEQLLRFAPSKDGRVEGSTPASTDGHPR